MICGSPGCDTHTALADEELLWIIQQERAQRCKKSNARGRPGTTAEMILRMLRWMHWGWSFAEPTREIRANLGYCEFGPGYPSARTGRTWYAPAGLATWLFVMGIAIFAFRRSLGTRELFSAEATP